MSNVTLHNDKCYEMSLVKLFTKVWTDWTFLCIEIGGHDVGFWTYLHFPSYVPAQRIYLKQFPFMNLTGHVYNEEKNLLIIFGNHDSQMYNTTIMEANFFSVYNIPAFQRKQYMYFPELFDMKM